MTTPNKPLQLTGKQLYELKWFCENVVGVRGDFYSVFDSVGNFDERLKRLEKTCDLIESFLEMEGQKLEPTPDNIPEEINVLKLPRIIPGERVQELVAWVDDRTLEELESLKAWFELNKVSNR